MGILFYFMKSNVSLVFFILQYISYSVDCNVAANFNHKDCLAFCDNPDNYHDPDCDNFHHRSQIERDANPIDNDTTMNGLDRNNDYPGVTFNSSDSYSKPS